MNTHAPVVAPPPGVARLMALLLPTALAMFAMFQGIQQILVPVQVEAVDTQSKIANLALLTVLCSVTGVLGLAAGGTASDAARARPGRPAPWIAGMAGASVLLSIGLGLQSTLLGIGAFYGALLFALNFFQGALLAVTPHRVPENRRSLASSIFGVAAPLGALVGVNLAALAPGECGYALLAIMLAAASTAFVIFAREDARSSPAATRDTGQERSGCGLAPVRALLEGFGSRDFSFAFAFRVLMFIAQFSINNYLFYILQDHIGVENLPAQNPRIAAGALNSLRSLATVVAIVIGAWIASRTGRRKLFAQVYALGMAAAMIVPVLSPTWFGMLIFALLGGLAVSLRQRF